MSGTSEWLADDGRGHLTVLVLGVDQAYLLAHVEVVHVERSLVQRVAFGRLLDRRDREVGLPVDFDFAEDLTGVGVFESVGHLAGHIRILPLGSRG